MQFPMKIQPIDCETPPKLPIRNDHVKPLVKSRFKRLLEWQFSKVSSIERDEIERNNTDFEPNSVCLAKMVQNFMEDNTDKHSFAVKCSRNRCNCFQGNCSDSSDDELYFSRRSGDSINPAPFSVVTEVLKGLLSCVSKTEKNLSADTTKILDRNKICKGKDDCRKIVVEGLRGIGYDASICKSKWEKSSSYPSGEYEYIDVIIEGERLLIDVDFKSEFEIARSTGNYKSILQSLPSIFVGKTEKLQQIVSIISDAAKQSLKKKGMHIPPWRKTEYMRAKWLSPYTRDSNSIELESKLPIGIEGTSGAIKTKNFSGEFELFFKEESSNSNSGDFNSEKEKIKVVVTPWEPPAIKPKSSQKGRKMVAGLASVLKEKQ